MMMMVVMKGVTRLVLGHQFLRGRSGRGLVCDAGGQKGVGSFLGFGGSLWVIHRRYSSRSDSSSKCKRGRVVRKGKASSRQKKRDGSEKNGSGKKLLEVELDRANSPLTSGNGDGSPFDYHRDLELLYQKKSPIEHIILRSDTYIGSRNLVQQHQWVYSSVERRVVPKLCSYVPGLYKIFDEILVNAADHYRRDSSGLKCICVDIDRATGIISIYNDGAGIPVQIHRTEKIYLPELLLGQLLTGSNFDDETAKVTGGRNGYGAKLANIFSRSFTVETYDAKTGLFYRQTWKDHMSVKGEPMVVRPGDLESGCIGSILDKQAVIERLLKSKGKSKGEISKVVHEKSTLLPFTRITFEPDFSLFGMKSLYETDIYPIICRRVYDIACIVPQISVLLNGKNVPNNFSKIYKIESSEHSEMFFVSPHPHWTIGVGCLAVPSQLVQLSFVNCIHTLCGGSHVNFVVDSLVKYVIDRFKRKFKKVSITPSHVRNHLIVFVNCLVKNPSFDSQAKERLTTNCDSFEFKLEEKVLRTIVDRIGLLDCISDRMEYQRTQSFARQATSRKTHHVLGIPKLDDANEAGGPYSHKCTLIITEGDSAKALAVSGLSIIGRDFYGVFPIQGKMLNVRDCKTSRIISNQEISSLIRAIGLKIGHDYSNWAKESSTLRYGGVLLMTDQDFDGSHIKGLFINFIHRFWPALLRADFLSEFITPILKVFRGSGIWSFYSLSEYEEWKSRLNPKELTSYSTKYYKGLGTNTSAEAKVYFSNLDKHVVKFKWDPNCDKMIGLVFSRQSAASRRQWLSSYRPSVLDTDTGEVTISDFINRELIGFSHYDNMRSLPSVIDGLKPSQRKVMYAAFKRRLYSDLKVAQLAGYVSEQTTYHHGEVSLQNTIVNIAQNFVGANILPLLEPVGQFGTRLQGGKDAASARYIYTKLSPYARLLFSAEDDPLLQYLEDDGQQIEPRWYIPIIPVVLVNGSEGLGTGWSTFIPTYNPLHIIDNIRHRMNGQKLRNMVPFFRGFQGETVVKGQICTTTGCFTFSQSHLTITELPVARWTNDYKIFLEQLLKQKKLVKSYTEHHTEDTVHFEIELMEHEETYDAEKIVALFKLESSFYLNNMTAFDRNGHLKKYNPLQIIIEFYQIRLEFYALRKTNLMKKLQSKYENLKELERFITSVLDGHINLIGTKKEKVYEQLISNNFKPQSQSTKDPDNKKITQKDLDSSFSHLLNTPLWHLTEEHVKELKNNVTNVVSEIETLQFTTPVDMWKKELDSLETQLRKDKLISEPINQKTQKKQQIPTSPP